MRLTAIESLHDAVSLQWEDGYSCLFTWFWLRDHATDAESFDPRSHQREIFTASISPTIQPREVSLDSNGDLIVEWPDTAMASQYSAVTLRSLTTNNTQLIKPVSWDNQKITQSSNSMHWDQLFDSQGTGNKKLLSQLASNGFCLLTNCPENSETVARVAASIGYVRETLFGGIWTFSEDKEMDDSAYTSGHLRPHTDGTYSEDAPGLQLLLCLQYEATGGASTLVDGFHISGQLSQAHQDVLKQVPVTGQYIGDGFHLQATRPVLRSNDKGTLQQVSFNNYDRAPFWLPEPEMSHFYQALTAFDQLANDPVYQWRHQLQPGELLIFDNWRVLHGREAYSGKRTMTGCYINREDFLSTLRQLGDN